MTPTNAAIEKAQVGFGMGTVEATHTTVSARALAIAELIEVHIKMGYSPNFVYHHEVDAGSVFVGGDRTGVFFPNPVLPELYYDVFYYTQG